MLMKKLFTLLLLTLGMAIGSAQAQDKKTWDFQNGGLSPETIANLDADEANWTKEGTDADGNTTGWKEATKHTGAFKANDVVIPELAGIELVNSGLSKNNNVIIRKDRVRLNRKDMKFKLPQLKNGQTVTIVCQSANSSATDRGVKASYDYMKRIEGPEDNLILGSEGLVTNVWQIEADGEEPVDVEFTIISGGIDFRLIMIDNGDEAKAAKLAYLYNGQDDQVLGYLQANELYQVTPIDVTTTPVTAEELQQYEVTIVGSSVPADNAAVQVVKEAMPWTPVLNLNATLYPAWTYGETVEVAPVAIVKNSGNAFFKDVELTEMNDIKGLFISEENPMLAVKLGEYFDGDAMLALAMDNETGEGIADIAAIHTHNIGHNGYAFLPYNAKEITPEALAVLQNAITTLQNSKRDITAANAPSIAREYKHRQTLVTITPPSLPKAKVYYTIDGTEPTTASTPYEGTFALTQPCTLKAAAIAEGYTLSASASLDVLIKDQPQTPVISYEMGDGQTTITMGCETPDVKIWYNFDNAVDTTKSSVYDMAQPVVIQMPQDVTVFATTIDEDPTEVVFSETATQRVLVKNPRVVIDVAAHFSAPAWDGISNGSGLFSGGKNATSMYDTTQEPIGEQADPETGDVVYIYPEVEWQTKDEPGDTPQWTVMSKGQAVLWQNNGASTDKIGTNEGGYYPTVATDIDELFPVTKNDIQFSKIFAGEAPNAAIQSKATFKAPLDIVVLANMQGGPVVAQVSADGENWTTVGDEIAKTGFSRMWAKYVRQYEGTDEVYVRLAQLSGDASAKIFDIYVANQGEQSQALLQQLNEELSGISTVEQNDRRKAVSGIYNLRGMRLQQMQRGLNIIVAADGKARKVMVK